MLVQGILLMFMFLLSTLFFYPFLNTIVEGMVTTFGISTDSSVYFGLTMVILLFSVSPAIILLFFLYKAPSFFGQ